MNPTVKPKVLIYLLGSLGDTLIAIPALRAIRRHFGDAELVLLHNFHDGNIVNSSQVLGRYLIDGYIQYGRADGATGKLREFVRLRNEIRKHRFDAIINLVDSERPARSVKRDEFFFRACQIPRRIGFNLFSQEQLYPIDEFGYPALTDNEALRKLKRNAINGISFSDADLRQPTLELTEADREFSRDWRSANNLLGPRFVALAPGCKQPSNLWPLERFINLASRIRAMGYEILVLGGENERPLGRELIEVVGGGTSAAGDLTVRQSAAIMADAECYVGLDTGSTHLAAAVGLRCFVISGQRVNPGQWYPLGEGHYVVGHKVPCAGCRAFACPLPGHPCMLDISVEDAWASFEKFSLSNESSGNADVTAIYV